MLRDELKKISKQFKESAPLEVVEIIEKSIAELAKGKILETSLKVGDKIPDFILANAMGKNINSKELLSEGPLVINFYRGGWWPFCNLELGGYQEILGEINEKGAQLIAISPELPDNSISLKEKLNLGYEILSDLDNKTAKSFGIVFTVAGELKKIYENFGLDLEKINGTTTSELPVPATYVVDRDGSIILAHLDFDYTTRMEPEEVLEVL